MKHHTSDAIAKPAEEADDEAPRRQDEAEEPSRQRLVIAGREYLDANGMAEAAGMSRAAVLRLARRRRVPYYQLGRRWVFDPVEFMAALRRAPDAAAPAASALPPVRRRRAA